MGFLGLKVYLNTYTILSPLLSEIDSVLLGEEATNIFACWLALEYSTF